MGYARVYEQSVGFLKDCAFPNTHGTGYYGHGNHEKLCCQHR